MKGVLYAGLKCVCANFKATFLGVMKMRYQKHDRDSYWALNAKSILLVGLMLTLFFSLVPVKADWEDDANARIEANRKRDVQITVVDLEGYPINNVDVQINQIKHRFGFGSCLNYGNITQTDHQDFVVDHFEWATCENEMKWSSNENTRDVWTFSQADYIADFCADNDIKLRGHTLVWETGGQTPSWVSGLACATYPTASEMLEEIDERIDYTVGRYAGQIVEWDVDNEMLSGNMFDCLGEQGRAHFFQRGNSIDPNCRFCMNEYSNNSFGGYDGDAYASRALGLISLGAPVECLGIQAHVASPFDPERYYSNVLQELAVVGVPIIATEFDTDASTEAQAATDLENLYRICFSHPSVEGIIMWGYDQNVWRGNGIVDSSTWVLNEAGVRYEALLAEWTTNTSDTTDTYGEADFRGFHGTYEITLTAGGEPSEIYEIELEPGTGTAEFVLQMDIGPPDTTPPSPDPMEWAVNGEPEAASPTSITMTAATATDNNPPVEYYFECTTDSDANSTWQTNTTYVAQGLDPDTEYTFRVKARDNSSNQNETGYSDPASATTYPPDLTAPEPDPMEWSAGGQPSTVNSSSITMTAETATDAVSPPVEYYFECTNDAGKSSTWQTNTTYVAQGLDPLTQYTFRVMARDSAPALNETAFSGTASATTEAPPTDIEILGSWTTGLSHTEESGYSRALIFIAHAEHATTIDLSSVNYGGQAMNQIIERNTGGTGYQAYVAAYILDEDGINAASSSTFSATWTTTPENVSYASVFLANVDQTTPVGATASNSATSGNTITTSALATGDGDFVIDAVICGNVGDYAMDNGFTKPFEQDMSSSTSADGYKFATGVDETPSATFTGTMNRQAIIGFVIQSVPSIVDYPPAAPTGLVATAGNDLVSLDWNDNSEGDLAGYDVYRSGYSGGGYSQINGSLVVDSDYVDNNVDNFEDYYYVVKAVDANDNESGFSNEEKAIPDLYQNCTEVQTGGDGLVSDLTGDCYVDLEDLDIVVEYWLDTDCGSSGNCQGADFAPTDGDVDLEDFSDFAMDWMLCNNPGDSGCIKNWWPAE